MSDNIMNQILSAIKSSNNILLVSHQRPDGDTIGANIALSLYIKQLGKNYLSFCVDPIPEEYLYLAEASLFSTDPSLFRNPNLDLIITLDSGDLKYAGIQALANGASQKQPFIINVDHHTTNTQYGNLNLVAPEAAATCEIIYRFFNYHKIKINKDMATAIMTGIIMDTGQFFNPATNTSAFSIAGNLLCCGANSKKISQNLINNKSVSALRVWGNALARLKHHKTLDMVTTVVKAKDCPREENLEESLEGLTNFLSAVIKARFIAVFYEKKDGWIKASLRSLSDDVDVSKLVKDYDGGGHKKAAGFQVRAEIIEEEERWRIMRT